MIPGITASQAFVAGAAGPTFDGFPSFSEKQVSLANSTTYSFDITCVAGKSMVIFFWGHNSTTWRTPVSVTLDGGDLGSGPEAFGATALYLSDRELVPAGIPGDGTFPLEIVWDDVQERCGICVFIGDTNPAHNAGTAWNTELVFPQDDVNNTLDTFVGGGAVAFLIAEGSGGDATTTYTNITEVFDEAIGEASLFQSGAYGDTSATPQTTFVITTANVSGETAGILLTYKP